MATQIVPDATAAFMDGTETQITNSSNTPSGEQSLASLQGLHALLFEIAGVANDMDGACFNLLSTAEEDVDVAGDLIKVLRSALCRIGWMADLALSDSGGMPLRGPADEWLLSPAAATRGTSQQAQAQARQ